MKRNHKRRKGSPRSQYSFFDYILVIGVVALITGGVYYFAKAFYEPEGTQVSRSVKKFKEIKPKAEITEAENTFIENVKDEELETIINITASENTSSTLNPKPAIEPKSEKRKKKQKPVRVIPSITVAEPVHEPANTRITETEHTEINLVDVETSQPESNVEPEPTNEILHDEPEVTIQPPVMIEPVITIEPVQVAPVVTSGPESTETTSNEDVKAIPFDPEDILPQLFDTILDDKADVLEELIDLFASGDHTIDINVVSSKLKYNVLHIAAMTGKLECLRVILRHMNAFNFKINDRSEDMVETTPLLLACYLADYFPEVAVEVVQLLINHGADIELADKHGYTPVMAVIQTSHLGVVNLLLGLNANIRQTAKGTNHSILHHAMDFCNRPVMKALIDHGADMHAVNAYNRQPIHEAAAKGCVDGLRELILTREVDKQTLSPLREENKYSAHFESECLFGATPLHFAAYFAKLQAVEFLFLIQAMFQAEDQDGRNAAWYADNLYNSKKMERVEVFYYFEDRFEWENEEKRYFGKIRQIEDEIRRLDESPSPTRFEAILSNYLHLKKEIKLS